MASSSNSAVRDAPDVAEDVPGQEAWGWVEKEVQMALGMCKRDGRKGMNGMEKEGVRMGMGRTALLRAWEYRSVREGGRW